MQATTTREPTLAERFDPRPGDDARLETAIGRRNTTWARWREAEAQLAAARERGYDPRPWVRNYNDALRDYEYAKVDLLYEKARWERDGVPW